jgi:hypothetical protein
VQDIKWHCFVVGYWKKEWKRKERKEDRKKTEEEETKK